MALPPETDQPRDRALNIFLDLWANWSNLTAQEDSRLPAFGQTVDRIRPAIAAHLHKSDNARTKVFASLLDYLWKCLSRSTSS